MKLKLKSKKYTVPALAVVVWFCVWPFTPGLLSWNIGKLIFTDDNIALVISILFAVAIISILYITHSRFNTSLFKRHWAIWLYLLPLLALLIIPFRITDENELIFGLTPWLYIFMIATSVVMQQYITFGLLQSYLVKAVRPWLGIVITAGIFYLGHALFLSHNFSLAQPLNALYIILLGFVFAFVRHKTGSLHANLALHGLFYFVLIG